MTGIQKCPTGIAGFDEITHGGLPRRRTTLLCGGAGCGKTLFGMQFLVRGIVDHGEPGVFVAFEELAEELTKNVASLGFDLDALCAEGKLAVDHVRLERSEIEETGDYNLDGLFLRLQLAIQSVGAKRVVIDTLETLFGTFDNYAILRAELRRLFRWLHEQEVTAIVTAERGQGTLTRHGLEEYVSDCVVLLDHRVDQQVSTRRLRVVKYRGSAHGTNEYPFLIDADGLSVMPITSAHLTHEVSSERISSGIPRLDTMIGGGYFRGSTVLVSGTAGAGKTSIAAHFAHAAAQRGERCVFFSFEESASQLKRNMRSIGIDLDAHERAGLLQFSTARPTTHGLETHLAIMHKVVDTFRPRAVVVDPISNMISSGTREEAHLMALRFIDFLKTRQITALLTTLNKHDRAQMTEISISSVVDAWLLLEGLESAGERNRVLYVLKSRGTAHSNQIREFVIGGRGIDLVDVYVGPEGVLTGSARTMQEHRERVAATLRRRDFERQQRELECRKANLHQQIEAMRAEIESADAELRLLAAEDDENEQRLALQRQRMAVRRHADRDEERASEDGMNSSPSRPNRRMS